VSGHAATVLTHSYPEALVEALSRLRAAAASAGFTLRFDPDETRKHRVSSEDGIVANAPIDTGVDVCLVLGGDGTILRALRLYARTGVPVFAINYGEVGFLATVEPDQFDEGLKRAFSGDFEAMELPAVVLGDGDDWTGINDVSFHRKPGLRVADLAYAIGPDEVGRVRCDGLVVSTPAGSTGYNLANGGPVMAWGVEGYVVSFIAPHSLTARTLVVAPEDVITVQNRSREEPADVTVDGRPVCELPAGEALQIRFVDAQTILAQLPGANFYHRLRETFGRLAFYARPG
jgi:NAD+ kinase